MVQQVTKKRAGAVDPWNTPAVSTKNVFGHNQDVEITDIWGAVEPLPDGSGDMLANSEGPRLYVKGRFLSKATDTEADTETDTETADKIYEFRWNFGPALLPAFSNDGGKTWSHKGPGTLVTYLSGTPPTKSAAVQKFFESIRENGITLSVAKYTIKSLPDPNAEVEYPFPMKEVPAIDLTSLKGYTFHLINKLETESKRDKEQREKKGFREPRGTLVVDSIVARPKGVRANAPTAVAATIAEEKPEEYQELALTLQSLRTDPMSWTEYTSMISKTRLSPAAKKLSQDVAKIKDLVKVEKVGGALTVTIIE